MRAELAKTLLLWGFAGLDKKKKTFKKEENVAFLAAFFPSTGIH